MKTLIRLRIRAGWSESSLGAHARRFVFSRCGPFKLNSFIRETFIRALHREFRYDQNVTWISNYIFHRAYVSGSMTKSSLVTKINFTSIKFLNYVLLYASCVKWQHFYIQTVMFYKSARYFLFHFLRHYIKNIFSSFKGRHRHWYFSSERMANHLFMKISSNCRCKIF